MDYEIIELDEFEVMGRRYHLSKSLDKNVRIAQRHWRHFNHTLRKNRVQLKRNWVKYAFITEINNNLYYCIAVAKSDPIPEGFSRMTIPKGTYLKAEHKGSMGRLKASVDSAYCILSKNNIKPNQNEFHYFERYDYRFGWNSKDSVIELHFPIQ